jgi:hypothetical protein
LEKDGIGQIQSDNLFKIPNHGLQLAREAYYSGKYLDRNVMAMALNISVIGSGLATVGLLCLTFVQTAETLESRELRSQLNTLVESEKRANRSKDSLIVTLSDKEREVLKLRSSDSSLKATVLRLEVELQKSKKKGP